MHGAGEGWKPGTPRSGVGRDPTGPRGTSPRVCHSLPLRPARGTVRQPFGEEGGRSSETHGQPRETRLHCACLSGTFTDDPP